MGKGKGETKGAAEGQPEPVRRLHMRVVCPPGFSGPRAAAEAPMKAGLCLRARLLAEIDVLDVVAVETRR